MSIVIYNEIDLHHSKICICMLNYSVQLVLFRVEIKALEDKS